jgi:branched-chain amino acid aminotransferase
VLADEVFLTGTAARIAPVTSIEQYKLPDEHPVATKLVTALNAILNQEDSKHADWVTSIAAAGK